MNNETEKNENLPIEELLTPQKLKEIAGKEGQYIKLVDVQQTEDLLKDLAAKYEGLEVTEENYKKEALEAERELRNTRYALQRIQKANNKFLNEVKREEKEIFENLIGVIQPQEERLKSQIDKLEEAERKAKEEAERREKERIEKIENSLNAAKMALERALIKGRTDEDLKEYDEFLADLKAKFETFEEMEFKAQRIHAVYTGRRQELVKQINEAKELEREKAELKRRKEIENQRIREEIKRREELFKKREEVLIKIGFQREVGAFKLGDLFYLLSEVKEANELDFFEIQQKAIEEKEKVEQKKKEEEQKRAEALKAEEQRRKEKQKEKEQNKIKEARKAWDDMFTIFCGLGGDPTKFRLKSDELPSEKDVKRLRAEVDELHRKKREEEAEMKKEKAEEVKAELNPFVNEILDFFGNVEKQVDKLNFKHEETENILKSFLRKSELLAKTVFGEVYNK